MKKRIVPIVILVVLAVVLSVMLRRDGKAYNVLLISVDTLRPDHLGCYGYEPIDTRNVDGIAADGFLFTQAHAPVPLTLPAHTSLFTGLYPKHHQVSGQSNLHPAVNTLGDQLSDAGYLCGGFTGFDTWLLPERGMGRGFDLYNHAVPAFRPIADTLPMATEWIRRLGSNTPYFLFLHTFDAHSSLNGLEDRTLPYETGE